LPGEAGLVPCWVFRYPAPPSAAAVERRERLTFRERRTHVSQDTAVSVQPAGEDQLWGHPRGLYWLFSTELWERFSFYSMRGILTLYIAQVVLAVMGAAAGGQADQIYGAYLGFVYTAPFIGGMLADRLLGQRRAIYIGGFLMALAQFALATHAMLTSGGYPAEKLHPLFFAGLALLACGNGFFKPNISTIVGALYDQKDQRRDSAFTIFYMGINIGAFLASFSGGIAQKWGWYIGYLLAGTGMIVSLIIFISGLRTLGTHGLSPVGAKLSGAGRFGVPNGALVLLGVLVFVPVAAFLISRPTYVQWLAVLIGLIVLPYLIFEALRGTREERGRIIVIIVLCCFSMLFWGFFELAGSTITRFTEDRIDRVVFGRELPAAFLANVVNPLLIIALCIPFAGLWVWLNRRGREPSSPLKFSMGLAQLGLGFLMLYFGAQQAQSTGKCSLIWLVLAFVFHTTGELCLSPVGLSMITKLSPARLVGMFMGVWFLSSALANVITGGLVGRLTEKWDFGPVFLMIFCVTGGAALVLLMLVPLLKKLMHGVK
jgi:proton-dependent oligopeptide transporter, POT family